MLSTDGCQKTSGVIMLRGGVRGTLPAASKSKTFTHNSATQHNTSQFISTAFLSFGDKSILCVAYVYIYTFVDTVQAQIPKFKVQCFEITI